MRINARCVHAPRGLTLPTVLAPHYVHAPQFGRTLPVDAVRRAAAQCVAVRRQETASSENFLATGLRRGVSLFFYPHSGAAMELR